MAQSVGAPEWGDRLFPFATLALVPEMPPDWAGVGRVVGGGGCPDDHRRCRLQLPEGAGRWTGANAASSANGTEHKLGAASRVLALPCVPPARLVGQHDPPNKTRGSAGGSRTTEVDGVRDSSSMHPRPNPVYHPRGERSRKVRETRHRDSMELITWSDNR